MTKREFLDKLKKALVNDLSGSVIQENVNYYNDYITEEVRKGRRESDVIEELGDPWAIAKNIITSEEMKGNTQESYDSYEPGRRRENSYEQDYGSESGYRGTHVFGLDTWWKKLVLILGITPLSTSVSASTPIPRPVIKRTIERTIAATHSIRSCPYGCSLSGCLDDSLIPITTIIVLNTSDAEWILSLIIAFECANTPANSFMNAKRMFTTIVTKDT